MGGVGFNVETKDEFREAFEKAVNSGKVAFLNVKVDRREDVLPMVPPNSPLNNMLVFKEEE
jgi:acetolactate synthase-1/2/3 large subunit